jgi:hypothetical protein
MRKHNAIITGSFMLQFLDDVLWENLDLNIYVQQGAGGVEAICDHLCHAERYTLANVAIEPLTSHEVRLWITFSLFTLINLIVLDYEPGVYRQRRSEESAAYLNCYPSRFVCLGLELHYFTHQLHDGKLATFSA